jgi:hypothetical protein
MKLPLNKSLNIRNRENLINSDILLIAVFEVYMKTKKPTTLL